MNGEISKYNEFILQNLIEKKNILVVSADRKRHLENYMTFCKFIEDEKIYKVVYFNKSVELPNGSEVKFVVENEINTLQGIVINEFVYFGNKTEILEFLQTRKRN